MNPSPPALEQSVYSNSAARITATHVIGALFGSAATFNLLIFLGSLKVDLGPISLLRLILILQVGAALGILTLFAIDWAARRITRGLPAEAQARLRAIEPFALLPAFLPLLGAFGLFIPLLATILLLLAARALAVVVALPGDTRRQAFSSLGYLSFLFLISGFAALIYQIVWQRTLFTAFGVNIESITIIVSLFMFGLGIGSFFGGLLSHWFPARAPLLFFACEAGIGLFGIVSLPLIGAVSRANLHGSLAQVSLAVFALLCLPTMLMGATLPILVTHLNRHLKSVGKSVGLLYCINTVGSAIACFLTADLLFVVFGQQQSVYVAAACNLTVGLLVFDFARRIAKQVPSAKCQVPNEGIGHRALGIGQDQCPITNAQCPSDIQPSSLDTRHSTLDTSPAPSMAHRLFVVFFAAATGYISLSQEMVWMRIVSYMTGGQPAVFAYVLGFFLVGVAFGALLAEKLCDRYFSATRSPVRFIALMLLVSGVFYFLSIAGTAELARRNLWLGIAATHLVVAVVSFLLGGIFPVLCHYGARAGQGVGLAVSRLYLANIVGSTLGPLLTGFVLMEYFSTASIILGLSIATVLLGGGAWLIGSGPATRRWIIAPAASAVLIAGLVVGYQPLYDGILEKLQCDRERAWHPYNHLVENRHGIISTVAAPDGDVIYGGGMYDGTFNTDPVVNSNWITRCYLIAGLHPKPEEVLEIGLSSGSWTKVMANYGPVRKLTVVEINPGYLEVIGHYAEQRTILDNPKVDIQIDDGRRWLNRHPDRKFDLIVQNTTWHWRSQITNLVSAEYLQLCKAHLKDGGVLYYNTTFSDDIAYTASRIFKYVAKFGEGDHADNFVAASDRPFTLTRDQIRANLLQFQVDGGASAQSPRPVFDEQDPKYKQMLDWLAERHLEDPAKFYASGARLKVITDDNMATEYKRIPLFNPSRSWMEYLGELKPSWRPAGGGK